MEIFTIGMLFLIGIVFGSFFTLAVYRIPKGENILYKHSYCPNCHHKLGILDLIPVLSYLFLGGKCRYCHEKVRIRYLLLEILSGLVFVLYGYSTKLNIITADVKDFVSLFFMVLYLVGLFIIAGIDKERKEIQTSVLWYEVFVSMAYMIYICTFYIQNAYIYVIYLSILILAILLDVTFLRKNTRPCYWVRVWILLMAMLIANREKVLTLTVILAIIVTVVYQIIKWIKQKLHKFRKKDNFRRKKLPIGFILCITNIISILIVNWIEYYYVG